MVSQDIKSLVQEAKIAADPRGGGLLDRRDLQQLIGRLADAIGELLVERDVLANRLQRTPIDAPLAPVGDWRHHANCQPPN